MIKYITSYECDILKKEIINSLSPDIRGISPGLLSPPPYSYDDSDHYLNKRREIH